MKIKDIKDNEGTPKFENYNIGFSTRPFPSFSISPKVTDNNQLFHFTMFRGDSNWLCGMTKTSYYQNYVYNNRFNDEDDIEKVINYIDSVLKNLKDTLNKINL